MKTRVKIDGKYKTYDLTRYRSISQFKLRQRVIVAHPESSYLCIARVVERTGRYIMFREESDSIAPYVWRIYKGNLFQEVFIIN